VEKHDDDNEEKKKTKEKKRRDRQVSRQKIKGGRTLWENTTRRRILLANTSDRGCKQIK